MNSPEKESRFLFIFLLAEFYDMLVKIISFALFNSKAIPLTEDP